MGVKTDKQQYFNKLKGLLEDYKSIFIVSVDNVRLPLVSREIACGRNADSFS